jgi:hypothetical protein
VAPAQGARAKGGAGLIVVEVALVDDAAVFVAHPIKVTGASLYSMAPYWRGALPP